MSANVAEKRHAGDGNGKAGAQAVQRLWIQPPPHVRSPETTSRLIRLTLFASAVPALVAVAEYGMSAAWLMAAGVAGAMAAEALCERALGRKAFGTLADASAMMTGLLLSLTLPADAPVWMAVLGGFVAIALGKHIFGGLGRNLFNPALIGHVFLLGSFTAVLASGGRGGAVSLLELARQGKVIPDYLPLLWNGGPGPMAAASPVAAFAAALLVLGWGSGRWQAPAGFFAGSAAVAALLGWNPVFHWLAGLAPLTVAFFVNDPATTPVTGGGRFAFGLGVGALMVLLRSKGSYLEGAAFAVLIMNAVSPLLNRAAVAMRRRNWQVLREAKPLNTVSRAAWRADLQAVLVLVLVTSVAGVLLGTFYHATAPLIASQQLKREIESGLKVVLPGAATYEPLAEVDGTRVFVARDAQGNELGLGVFANGDGYKDTIRLAVGVDLAGNRLTGVRVLQQAETPGLGARIGEPEFLAQFEGKSLDDAFMPGDDVDGVSGATVSSVAVCDTVYEAIEAARKAVEGR